MRNLALFAAITVTFVLLSCDRRSGHSKDAERQSPKADASNSDVPAPPVYPLSAINAISVQCVSPKVLVAAATANTEHHYPWTLTRQALLANPQFRVVFSAPRAADQIHFRQVEARTRPSDVGGHARWLVAYCQDGDTCNRFAAMYAAVARSESPQPICGDLPANSGDDQLVDIQWNGALGDLPRPKDTLAQCARLAACMIAADPSMPGDPALECERSHKAWKTACSMKRSCAEVLACTRT